MRSFTSITLNNIEFAYQIDDAGKIWSKIKASEIGTV